MKRLLNRMVFIIIVFAVFTGAIPQNSAVYEWAIMSTSISLGAPYRVHAVASAVITAASFSTVKSYAPSDLKNAIITIKSIKNGKFLSAHVDRDFRNAIVIADASSAGQWEKFRVVACTDGTYALRSIENLRYLSASQQVAPPMERIVHAVRSSIKKDEKFTIEKVDGIFYIKAKANDKYLSVMNDNVVKAQGERHDAWEKFEIQVMTRSNGDYTSNYNDEEMKILHDPDWFNIDGTKLGFWDIQAEVYKDVYEIKKNYTYTMETLGYIPMKYNGKTLIDKDDMQCTIGVKQIDNGKYDVIVCFRGTDSNMDIIANLNDKITDGQHNGYYDFSRILVGIRSSVTAIVGGKLLTLENLITSAIGKNTSFTILGHSLGGAVAQCFAIYLLDNRKIDKSQIRGRTFESAMAVTGDNKYRENTGSQAGKVYLQDWYNIALDSDTVPCGNVLGSLERSGGGNIGRTVWLVDPEPDIVRGDGDIWGAEIGDVFNDKHVMWQYEKNKVKYFSTPLSEMLSHYRDSDSEKSCSDGMRYVNGRHIICGYVWYSDSVKTTTNVIENPTKPPTSSGGGTFTVSHKYVNVTGECNIINISSGKYLNNFGGNIDGGRVTASNGDGSTEQKWEVGAVGTTGASHIIKSLRGSGTHVLDIACSSAAELKPGTKTHMWSQTPFESKHWYFEYLGEGIYVIRSVLDDSLALAVSSNEHRSEVVVQTYIGSDMQKWRLTKPGSDSGSGDNGSGGSSTQDNIIPPAPMQSTAPTPPPTTSSPPVPSPSSDASPKSTPTIAPTPAPAAFVPRLTDPGVNGVYYNTGNPFPAKGNNCTWYAYGRAYELLTKKPDILTSPANGYQWWSNNKNKYDNGNGGYPYGSTPKLGAIACWDKGGNHGTLGHVAIVEKIENGNVYVSESTTSAESFRVKTVSWHGPILQGYIYILDGAQSADDSSRNIPPAVQNYSSLSGNYNIVNVSSGKYLNNFGGNTDGARVTASNGDGSAEQKWAVTTFSGHLNIIRSLRGNGTHVLDIACSSAADLKSGSITHMWSQTPFGSKHWYFEYLDANIYVIRSSLNENLALAVRTNEHRSDVIVQTYTGSDMQKWKLIPA